jgi:uncharacterized LabA/DUF88 family protein
MPNVAIFVDVQNIYYTTKDTFSRPFNYRQFYSDVQQNYDIACAFAYAIDKGDERQLKFQSALQHIGFEVKLKPFIQRSDGSAKGDWDVGITIDILEAAREYEHIILLSGDGDFAILLEHIYKKYQCTSTVYGVLNLTANSLINAATHFVDIDKGLLL